MVFSQFRLNERAVKRVSLQNRLVRSCTLIDAIRISGLVMGATDPGDYRPAFVPRLSPPFHLVNNFEKHFLLQRVNHT